MSAVIKEAAAEPAPANDTELRAALAWETGQPPPDDKSTWEWLWEALQGDFNDNRSTGQIAFDAAVSMIPLADQICDIRDLIANCRAIATSDEREDNTWKWVALALTLIGLIPTLGSALKGVLKIVFTFVRRHGIDHVAKAIDASMGWVITFLRKKEVQAYLRSKRVDEVFQWLAKGVRELQKQANTRALLAAFDGTIGVMKRLLEKVTWLPKVGDKAKQAIALVERVRQKAPQPLAKVDELLQRILGTLAQRLEMEHLLVRHGILDAHNIHFRGTLPQAHAITLMRTTEPPPSWLSKGRGLEWSQQKVKDARDKLVDQMTGKHLSAAERKLAAERGELWPELTDDNIMSFHKMAAVQIKGPTKLYRVVSPSNGAMGDCWVPEDVWQKIMASPDPKAAWRKYLAVWPDWNPNGQFVVLEVPAAQTLNVWRGPASSQFKDPMDKLDAHLEGGWDQVVFKPKPGEFDTTRYYRRGDKGSLDTRYPISREDFGKLPEAEKATYVAIRERINHPNIKGPLDTGWGATDFDEQWRDARIGLPALPGQVTNY